MSVSMFQYHAPLSINFNVGMYQNLWCGFNFIRRYTTCGPDSSIGIVTRYGLDGPGIESQ